MASTEINRKVIFNEHTKKYEWIIHNFLALTHNVGESITSEKFTSCATSHWSYEKWEMELYPNGDCKQHKGYVTVYLKSLNNHEINLDAVISSKLKGSDLHVFNAVRHIFEEKISTLKVRCFNRNLRINLVKNGSDILTVFFKINSVKSYEVHHKQRQFLKNIGSLLETGEHCSDVTLISSNGGEHKAHKVILICRSNVFLAMFQHDMKENNDNIVTIKDISDETLKSMLQFLYTGNIKNLNMDQAKELYKAADKYELNDLQEICLNFLINNMKADNILDLLEYAYAYDFNELQCFAKRYFFEHQPITIEPECINSLSRPVLVELLFGYQDFVKNYMEESLCSSTSKGSS